VHLWQYFVMQNTALLSPEELHVHNAATKQLGNCLHGFVIAEGV